MLCVKTGLALMGKKVPREMEKEWAPLLTSQSRWEHRGNLQWRNYTREFDYYAEVKTTTTTKFRF